MATENFELKYWDWIAKINERLTFARLKVGDGKDINEEEEALLKVLFPIWHNGEYPIYGTKLSITDEKAVDQGLFVDSVIKSPNGT